MVEFARPSIGENQVEPLPSEAGKKRRAVRNVEADSEVVAEKAPGNQMLRVFRARLCRPVGSPRRLPFPAPAAPDTRVCIRLFQTPAASVVTVPALGQLRRLARPDAALAAAPSTDYPRGFPTATF